MALDKKYYEGAELTGGFRIEKFVGAGAFAYVYKAYSQAGDTCAVKIQYNLVADARTRFSREVKVLKEIPPNDYLVKYYSDGTTKEGYPYLIMEFVDGMTLKEALKARPVWSVRESCEFMLQLCDAFGGLHQLGVVHRDVKPDNIMLTKNNTVKLMDLGLIKDAQGIFQLLESEDIMKGRDFAENLDKGVLAGTPEYMAPEQFSDPSLVDESLAKTDTWTDVYSLGLIFYEMLAGRKLFPFTPPPNAPQNEFAKALLGFLAKRTKQSDDDIVSPPKVPFQLWTVLARALHADPTLRQRTASDLASDIRHYLTTGEGVIEQDSDKTCAIDASAFLLAANAASAKDALMSSSSRNSGGSGEELYASNRQSFANMTPVDANRNIQQLTGLPALDNQDINALPYAEDAGDNNFWLWMILILLLLVVAAGLSFVFFILDPGK